jgi:hypothetical protein
VRGIGSTRGNRQLNRAIQVAAVTQIRNDTPRTRLLPTQGTKARAAKKPWTPISSDA